MNRKWLGGVAVLVLLVTSAMLLWPSVLRTYAVNRIEWAKRAGIYASPEEGMRHMIESSYTDIERIEIEQAGTNSFDGSMPHVWFVTARVYRTGQGEDEFDYPGSFFLHVDEGWVYLPEGAFPRSVGRAMERFGLYGCDAVTGNCR